MREQREARIKLVGRTTGSALLEQVARGLLHLDPKQRLSGEDMLSVLQAPASPAAGGRGQQAAADAQAPARDEEEAPARQEEGGRARREAVQGLHQAPVAVPAQPQLEGQLRRKNPAAVWDKYATVCSCRLLDGGIRVRATRDGVPEGAETLYDLADWHLLQHEKLDHFSLSVKILQHRSDTSGLVTFKAASAEEARMWIGAIEKTPQERMWRESENFSLQVCR